MLRTNLSTRPFYNERAVHIGLVAAGVLLLALTVFNVRQAVTLSRHNTELQARITREETQARELAKKAEEIRRSINEKELERVVTAAREANALIDQRTFSWTEFFNRIETTLPPDVMVTQVRPQIREDEATVEMIVVGRRSEDIDTFMQALETKGGFADVNLSQDEPTEDGLHRAVLSGRYAHRAGATAAAAQAPGASAPAGSRAGGGS
jgi:hypothetical protein